jgi:hypothetical protein
MNKSRSQASSTPVLTGTQARAIDFREGEKIDEEALRTLVRATVTLNTSTAQS